LQGFIKRFKTRIKGNNQSQARSLFSRLDQLDKALAHYKEVPSVRNQDGTVSLTIRFVPCRTIVEHMYPLDKTLSILQAMKGPFRWGLFFDETKWESADVVYEYYLWGRLYDSLRGWLERWNLVSPWLADCTLQTLRSWYRASNHIGYFEFGEQDRITEYVPNSLNWRYKHWPEMKGPNEIKSSDYKFTEWDPEAEDWRSYQKRQEANFKKHLLEYRKRTLKSLGKSKPYVARKKYANYHYEWLVDFQVNRLRISQIIRKHNQKGIRGLSHSTISEAIHSLARLIVLRLRTEPKQETHT
jgi:hypothetical protein